jgi:hypothetical protein
VKHPLTLSLERVIVRPTSGLIQGLAWRGNRDRAKQDEVIISPGPRSNWGLVIPSEFARVEALLDQVGVPPC